MRVVVACLVGIALGVVDALAISLAAELSSGGWRAASIVVNFALVWAGVAVLAGWIVRQWPIAMLAGLLSLLAAVLAYYAFFVAFGYRSSEDVWTPAIFWSVVAIVGGPFLGLVGAGCRRPDLLGLAARLVLPLGLYAQIAWRLRWGLPAHDKANALGLTALLLLATGLTLWAVWAYVAGRRSAVLTLSGPRR